MSHLKCSIMQRCWNFMKLSSFRNFATVLTFSTWKFRRKTIQTWTCHLLCWRTTFSIGYQVPSSFIFCFWKKKVFCWVLLICHWENNTWRFAFFFVQIIIIIRNHLSQFCWMSNSPKAAAWWCNSKKMPKNKNKETVFVLIRFDPFFRL